MRLCKVTESNENTPGLKVQAFSPTCILKTIFSNAIRSNKKDLVKYLEHDPDTANFFVIDKNVFRSRADSTCQGEIVAFHVRTLKVSDYCCF